MTRRDRAALVLALECVRGSKVGGVAMAIDALCFTDCDPYLPPVLVDAEAKMDDAIEYAPASPEWYRAHYHARDILRARLALLLRAILRADAGDCGKARCSGCRRVTRSSTVIAIGWCSCCERDARWSRLPIRPLWEQAPATRER